VIGNTAVCLQHICDGLLFFRLNEYVQFFTGLTNNLLSGVTEYLQKCIIDVSKSSFRHAGHCQRCGIRLEKFIEFLQHLLQLLTDGNILVDYLILFFPIPKYFFAIDLQMTDITIFPDDVYFVF